MLKIDTTKLEQGLLVTLRHAKSAQAALVRAGVHSFTDHDAMTVFFANAWGIAEAVCPVSKITTIPEYEDLLNKGYLVRFYRHKKLTSKQRTAAAQYYVQHLLGLKYPKKSSMILIALPIYNAIMDRTHMLPPMRETWCSQLDKRAFLSVDENCLDGIDGKKKDMFSPKTFENRIMFGLFEDITDTIIVEVKEDAS